MHDMCDYKKIDLNVPKNEMVSIYYPDGELITKTDNIELINYVRCQIYENDIIGCYAESGNKRIELNGHNIWIFGNNNLKILSRMIIGKNKFKKQHPEFD